MQRGKEKREIEIFKKEWTKIKKILSFPSFPRFIYTLPSHEKIQNSARMPWMKVSARECPFLEAETGSRSKGSLYKSVLERPLALSKEEEEKKKRD